MAHEEIKLEWQGREYRIPPRKIMGAIHAIENVITLPEMAEVAARGKISRIAAAYGAVLRYAGAQVEDLDVYYGMFGDPNNAEAMQTALAALVAMMVPPVTVASDAPVGKSEAAGS